MAVRRSARLRTRQASEEPQLPAEPVTNDNNDDNNNNNKKQKLSSVMERDETPAAEATTPKQTTTPKPSAIARTPLKTTPAQKKSPAAKTPTSVLPRPPHQEMHPSKVRQSTTKQADSGLILGFNPIKKDAEGNIMKDTAQNTPTKAKASPATSNFGTPGFEFKFSHEAQLSDEAKKLMETIREDAAKNRAELVQSRNEQSESDPKAAADRKIVMPKGKAGRFTNAHMAEFKKMNSIAGHASAFRATPERFQPVQKTLKRTNSKANLDASDSQGSPAKSPAKPTPAPDAPGAKRVKHNKTDDTSTSRPTDAEPTTPKQATQSRPRPAVRSSLMTPTRSSAARTTMTSIKPPRTSMIPSLARSPEMKQTTTPRTPRTDFNPRFKSNIPQLGSMGSIKSILRRSQPLFSKDPAKIAAGTHMTAPDFKPNLIFGAPRDTSEDQAQTTPSPKKRVEFSFSAASPQDTASASPSPSKIPTTAPGPVSDIVYPTLPVLTPDHATAKSASDEIKSPSIRHVRPSDVNPNETPMPEIPGMPHGLGNKKRHRATEDETDAENVPPVDSTPQERSAKRVKLSTATPAKMPTPSPTKPRSYTPLRATVSGSRVGTPRAVGTPRTGTPASARQKSRGALSISRLNMLSQPKNRS